MLVMCPVGPRTLPIAGLRGEKSGAEMMANHGILTVTWDERGMAPS